MSETWHADPAVLARYAAEGLDDVRASSLEAHLLTCETCRAAIVPLSEAPRLEAMWHAIETSLDAPRAGLLERALIRVGVRDHVARLLSATPSLRLSWLLAEGIALGSAALAAHGAAGRPDAGPMLFLFLVLAALTPVAGVAAAFGPGVDPTYEIGIASPMRSDQLLFIRASAVLVVSMVLGLVAASVLPGTGWTAALWLVPALGLTLATLALATWLRPIVAACAVGLAWIALAAVASTVEGDALAAFRMGGQLLSGLVVAVSVSVLALRHSAYEGRIPA
jgi:hypothetical protein